MKPVGLCIIHGEDCPADCPQTAHERRERGRVAPEDRRAHGPRMDGGEPPHYTDLTMAPEPPETRRLPWTPPPFRPLVGVKRDGTESGRTRSDRPNFANVGLGPWLVSSGDVGGRHVIFNGTDWVMARVSSLSHAYRFKSFEVAERVARLIGGSAHPWTPPKHGLFELIGPPTVKHRAWTYDMNDLSKSIASLREELLRLRGIQKEADENEAIAREGLPER